MMNRRDFLRTAAASTALAASGTAFGATEASPSPTKLNYLFIYTDDQGYGDLGCVGHPHLKTPNLDALAAEGARFTDFYVASPVCAPSRAAVMTGRLPDRYNMKFLCHNGQYDAPVYHHVPLSESALPCMLKEQGYRTGHIGKWHLSLTGYPGEPTPPDYGIDHWLVQPPEGRNLYKDPQNWTRNGEAVDGVLAPWSDALCADEAMAFIEGCKGQPFYLNYWTFTPHEDVVAPEDYKAMYAGLTPQEQTYYGALTHFDHHLGRVFAFLRNKDLWDSTVIIFASDNGPENMLLPWVTNSAGSTGPFRGAKHVLYEGGIRVPAIIRWPGLSKPGSVIREPASTLDLLPTLAGAAGCGLPQEKAPDGGDLRVVFTGGSVDRPHALYWQYDRSRENASRGEHFTSPPLAVREGRWKLMAESEFSAPRLYNLDYDAGEKWNLAETYPERTAQMLETLKAIHADVAASAAAVPRDAYLNELLPPPSKTPLHLG